MMTKKLPGLLSLALVTFVVVGCSGEDKASMENAAATVSEKTQDAAASVGDMASTAVDEAGYRGAGV